MFKTIYLTGFIILLIIRLFYRWRARATQIVESRKTTSLILLDSLAIVGVILIPLIYIFTPLLNFADYQLPSWVGWTGAVVFALALLLLWRSHADLGRNWSQTLELRREHQLISSGVYKYVRHPMYAALWLVGIACALLLHNWIAGWSNLASFIPLYFCRVPREEQMMLDQFGEVYQAYMNRTGRVIPRLN